MGDYGCEDLGRSSRQETTGGGAADNHEFDGLIENRDGSTLQHETTDNRPEHDYIADDGKHGLIFWPQPR